jgi:hypothetical protein
VPSRRRLARLAIIATIYAAVPPTMPDAHRVTSFCPGCCASKKLKRRKLGYDMDESHRRSFQAVRNPRRLHRLRSCEPPCTNLTSTSPILRSLERSASIQQDSQTISHTLVILQECLSPAACCPLTGMHVLCASAPALSRKRQHWLRAFTQYLPRLC